MHPNLNLFQDIGQTQRNAAMFIENRIETKRTEGVLYPQGLPQILRSQTVEQHSQN